MMFEMPPTITCVYCGEILEDNENFKLHLEEKHLYTSKTAKWVICSKCNYRCIR